MDKDRSIKELFELMLAHQDLFETGICRWCSKLYYYDFITRKESELMHKYLDKNLPIKMKYTAYCWKRGIIEPRIEWIEEQINQLTKNP